MTSTKALEGALRAVRLHKRVTDAASGSWAFAISQGRGYGARQTTCSTATLAGLYRSFVLPIRKSPIAKISELGHAGRTTGSGGDRGGVATLGTQAWAFQCQEHLEVQSTTEAVFLQEFGEIGHGQGLLRVRPKSSRRLEIFPLASGVDSKADEPNPWQSERFPAGLVQGRSATVFLRPLKVLESHFRTRRRRYGFER